ncbi:hypothetical protein SAMN04487988_10839 [Algoriphagus hitonicola]|uniref:6-bladed beta-propeller protein n=3 Tax=Algoriphagus hitonicola TaxID=435880 RepID=A0A1I2UNA4_9BACT|nr:hypothetical protein SAMN04487988_10839 [Algoriphagus hitonicola]
MLIMGMLISFFGCKNSNQLENEDSNQKFDWVSTNSISQTDFKILNKSNQVNIDQSEIGKDIHLSDLISEFSYLQLKNKEGHLLGDIDKILFTDSLIFVMDQYITNTLQVFERRTGNEVVYLEKSGEGPREFLEIYDFDIDREKKQILLFDGKLSKVLFFDFNGKFIEELKIPVRAQNFRKLKTDDYLFFTANLPNGHIEGLTDCVYFILNSEFQVKSCFSIEKKLESHGNYFSRDYFSSDGHDIYLFPRFSNELFRIDGKDEVLNQLVSVKLEAGIEKQDLVGEGLSFVDDRKKDRKFFSHGGSFVTNRIYGLEFRRFGGRSFYYFESLVSNERFYGSNINFDLPGMPFFSFPISSFKNVAISVIKFQQLRNLGVEKFKASLEKQGNLTLDLSDFLDNVIDFDQPAILIMEFK